MEPASGSSEPASGVMGLSRNTLIVVAVLALLAATGWWRAVDKSAKLTALQAAAAASETKLGAQVSELQANLASTTQRLADTEKANGALTEVQDKLAKATSSLDQRLVVLGDREKEAATLETAVKERTAAMDALEAQLAEAGGKLNHRLEALGEREREQADIDRALEALRQNRTASEAELASIQSSINERLKVLGEREQTLAADETQAREAAYRLEQLQAEAAGVEPRLTAMKAQLGQVDLQLVERQRAVDESFGKVAKAKQALEEIRQLVSQ